MKSYRAVIIVLVLLVLTPLFGEAFVADFLSLDADFVSTGLGRSKFAEGGAASIFGNPAGVNSSGPRYFVSHEALFGNMVMSDAAGALIPLKNANNLAVGALYHGGGGIEVTQLPDPSAPVGPDNRPIAVAEKGHHDIAIGAGYAVEVWRDVAVGATAGGMFRSLVDESGFGGFLSAGVSWDALPNLRLGAMFGNMSLASWSTGTSEFGAPNLSLGGVYGADLGGSFNGRLAGEIGYAPSERLFEFSTGAELSYRSIVAFRAGYADGNISAGADFALFPGIIIGAAMTTHSDLPLSYRFGVNIYRSDTEK
ncbi:MAG TPA: hypothetical protein ENN07_05180 [candidate division Zixibacteria bacterium]|nr:hypothetical protein [candidate division Zixibacteria bacterium]